MLCPCYNATLSYIYSTNPATQWVLGRKHANEIEVLSFTPHARTPFSRLLIDPNRVGRFGPKRAIAVAVAVASVAVWPRSVSISDRAASAVATSAMTARTMFFAPSVAAFSGGAVVFPPCCGYRRGLFPPTTDPLVIVN